MTDQSQTSNCPAVTPPPFPPSVLHLGNWEVCEEVACCLHCASIKASQEIELFVQSAEWREEPAECCMVGGINWNVTVPTCLVAAAAAAGAAASDCA